MTTSVVMCTYNGEKYIEQQLLTIFQQSRRPDEVIINDDCSKDRTVSIIRRFIEDHSLKKKWHLYVNSVNVGWKKNFMDAILKSRGDVIFFADQDDIWHFRKIEIMSKICEKRPEIDLLVCDCYPFDDSTGKRKRWFLPGLGNDRLNRVAIGRSFAECLRPGCTYALRRGMKVYIEDLWQEEWPHDLFFWCLALAKNSLFHCKGTFVKWRRTGENNTPQNSKTRENRCSVLDCQYGITKILIDRNDELHLSTENMEIMKRALRIYKQRKNAIEKGDWITIMKLFRYIRLYPKNTSWVADIVSTLNCDED